MNGNAAWEAMVSGEIVRNSESWIEYRYSASRDEIQYYCPIRRTWIATKNSIVWFMRQTFEPVE